MHPVEVLLWFPMLVLGHQTTVYHPPNSSDFDAAGFVTWLNHFASNSTAVGGLQNIMQNMAIFAPFTFARTRRVPQHK
jgi:hypothetical protein